ncbi:hypothetical protein MHYP_G00183960 [Metynnis hypsauchen]
MLPPQLGRVQRGPGAQPSITEEAERDTAIQPMAARFKLQPDAHAHTYAARHPLPCQLLIVPQQSNNKQTVPKHVTQRPAMTPQPPAISIIKADTLPPPLAKLRLSAAKRKMIPSHGITGHQEDLAAPG